MTPEDKALEARCRRALDKQGVTMRRVHSGARRNGGTYRLYAFAPTSGRCKVLCAGLTLAELEEAATHGPLLYAKVLRAQRADAAARAKLEHEAEQLRSELADERRRLAEYDSWRQTASQPDVRAGESPASPDPSTASSPGRRQRWRIRQSQ